MGTRRTNGEGTVFERPDRPGVFTCYRSWRDETTGKRRRRRFDAKSKSAAIARGKKWEKERAAGLKNDAKKLTVNEWLDIWMEKYKKNVLSKKSYEKYISSLKYVREAFGSKYLDKVSVAEFQCFIDELIEKGGFNGEGLSSSTVINVRKYFKASLAKAVRTGYITENIIGDTEPPRLIVKDYSVLEPKDIEKILAVAKKYGDTAYALIEFAAKTGCRRGEVFGLKWHRINLEKGSVIISNALVSTNQGQVWNDPKTKSSKRLINLPDDVVKTLKKYRAYQKKIKEEAGEKWKENDIVFANRNGGFLQMSNFMARVFKKIIIEAGLDPEKVHFHILRHSLASVLLENGVSPKEVQALLGHKSVLTTLKIYSHRISNNKSMTKTATEHLYSTKIADKEETAAQTVAQTQKYVFPTENKTSRNGLNTCEESFDCYKYTSAF